MFLPHYALLLAQGKAVGDHGDEFGIGRLALDVPVSIAIARFFASQVVHQVVYRGKISCLFW